MIDLTQRISVGRQSDLKAGDLLLKLVTVAAQVFEPLLQLTGSRIPETVKNSAMILKTNFRV